MFEATSFLANLVTIVALPLAVWGLWVGIKEYRYTRKATSAALFLSISDSFRASWDAYHTSPEDRQTFHFAETANLIERACALHADDVLDGYSKEMLEAYLDDVIEIMRLEKDRFRDLISSETTFSAMLAYIEKRAGKPSSPK